MQPTAAKMDVACGVNEGHVKVDMEVAHAVASAILPSHYIISSWVGARVGFVIRSFGSHD